jgi:alpha-glucosidase (family GH31 glycosyl hydrolase)
MPYPAISFKTIGGILDFFVFVGDNPEHVTQLYTSLIGRTFMPAFWSLGFQICKYGYHNTSHVKKIVDRTVKEKIPYVRIFRKIITCEDLKPFFI